MHSSVKSRFIHSFITTYNQLSSTNPKNHFLYCQNHIIPFRSLIHPISTLMYCPFRLQHPLNHPLQSFDLRVLLFNHIQQPSILIRSRSRSSPPMTIRLRRRRRRWTTSTRPCGWPTRRTARFPRRRRDAIVGTIGSGWSRQSCGIPAGVGRRLSVLLQLLVQGGIAPHPPGVVVCRFREVFAGLIDCYNGLAIVWWFGLVSDIRQPSVLQCSLGGEAFGGVFGEEFSYEVHGFIGDVSPFIIGEGGFVTGYSAEELLAIFAVKRCFAAEEEVGGNADGPHVHLLIVRLSVDNLGCCRTGGGKGREGCE